MTWILSSMEVSPIGGVILRKESIGGPAARPVIDNALGHKDLRLTVFDEKNPGFGGSARTGHSILWPALAVIALLVFALSGCSAGSGTRYAPLRADRTPVPAAHVVPESHSNTAVTHAAEDEFGPEVASTLPVVKIDPPAPIDPGAEALVDAMASRMTEREADADGVTQFGLSQIRNQSHAGAAEFEAFEHRFADLLSHAGHDRKMRFTADAEASVQYQCQGAAYIVVVDGMDSWELYLSVSRADQPWTVWEAKRPVHVLRQPRPGAPEILP